MHKKIGKIRSLSSQKIQKNSEMFPSMKVQLKQHNTRLREKSPKRGRAEKLKKSRNKNQKKQNKMKKKTIKSQKNKPKKKSSEKYI
ncbi:unnamed protein product [Caenorhabditis angaria]|uniref:Uncharacterized protein n=1 Tax=Caenorhabditis angaria TaxID=860376 RepID=A0A9P1J680_9PELO|nr:unnamed protein product [Caenorhabditis angaria]